MVIVRRLLAAMGVPLDADVARCLYAGLVTDTSSFVTAGESAHRLAAELVAAGVDAAAAGAPADGHPPARLARRARPGCCSDAVLEPDAAGGLGLVHTTVPRADVDRFRTEEVDSVVDMVRTTAEAEVAAVLKQVGRDAVDRPRCAPTAGSTWPRWPAGSAAAGIRGAAGFTWEGTADELLDVRCGAAVDCAGSAAGSPRSRAAVDSRTARRPR